MRVEPESLEKAVELLQREEVDCHLPLALLATKRDRYSSTKVYTEPLLKICNVW